MTSKISKKYSEKWKHCLICGEQFTDIKSYQDHLEHCLDYESVFEYLEVLRRSGVTNMFGAGPYLVQEFGCSKKQSHDALAAWMNNYEKFFPERGNES